MNLPLNINIQQILLHMLNFVILFAIFYLLLYKPIKKFIDKRNEYYKNLDDETKSNLAYSEKAKKECEARLESIDDELLEKANLSNKKAEEKGNQIIENAKEEAQNIIEKAVKEAEREKSKIINSASKEISQMVSESASKIIYSNTSDAFDGFLDSAERGAEDVTE